MGLMISPIVLPPGLPNAGKSSVLNAVLGRSAVSVSRTPGRTRYFQTHFLTPTVRLCDCPGLVFPSTAPRELQVGPQPPNSPLVSTNTAFIASFPPHPPPPQVLAGVYPISQLQEPYSAVGFLATRLPLPTLLALRPPSSPAGWTAWDICEGKSASFRVPITPNRGLLSPLPFPIPPSPPLPLLWWQRGLRSVAIARPGRRGTTCTGRPTASCAWRPTGVCCSACGPQDTAPTPVSELLPPVSPDPFLCHLTPPCVT